MLDRLRFGFLRIKCVVILAFIRQLLPVDSGGRRWRCKQLIISGTDSSVSPADIELLCLPARSAQLAEPFHPHRVDLTPALKMDEEGTHASRSRILTSERGLLRPRTQEKHLQRFRLLLGCKTQLVAEPPLLAHLLHQVNQLIATRYFWDIGERDHIRSLH